MQVDIWSDVVCPWCYIGKRRFERALAEFEHADEITVGWRNFELDPSAPQASTLPMAEQLSRKYGRSLEESQAMLADMDRLAAAEGLDYHLAETTGGNTFDAHRLIQLAGSHGLAGVMEEALFAAYFVQRVPIGDHEVLRRVAGEVGLPPDEVDEVLAGDRFADEVRADEALATEIGATGVPFFVVDRKWGIPGAQDTDTILSVLRRAWERRDGEPAAEGA